MSGAESPAIDIKNMESSRLLPFKVNPPALTTRTPGVCR